MFDPSKSLKKMLGKNLQVPRMMTGVKGPNDFDGDGIPNKRDCQPRNLIRQDKVDRLKIGNGWKKLDLSNDGENESLFVSDVVQWNDFGSMMEMGYIKKLDILTIITPPSPYGGNKNYSVIRAKLNRYGNPTEPYYNYFETNSLQQAIVALKKFSSK